eukprot:TRINITY_DN7416_c0_g2_i1.p1 TRINITY_DN7416_c0_g2~~TRINITY_DN7416_c0_g2_i1.p1  ORF type:complete len:304 (+),score=59.21 TRINITY_DN7416_c0_g2_i1:1-912(+)
MENDNNKSITDPLLAKEDASAENKNPANAPANSDERSAAKADTTATVTNFIETGGQLAKSGLVWTAGKLAGGISTTGEFLKKQLTKAPEETKVAESTQKTADSAKSTTKKVTLAVADTAKTVGGKITEVGSTISTKFKESETGKKLEANSTYQTAKKVGSATFGAVASIFDGLTQGLVVIGMDFIDKSEAEQICYVIVGRSVSNTTTSVVQHKYGDQAAQVVNNGFDAVGNIGLITRLHDKETVEKLKSDEQAAPNAAAPQGTDVQSKSIEDAKTPKEDQSGTQKFFKFFLHLKNLVLSLIHI